MTPTGARRRRWLRTMLASAGLVAVGAAVAIGAVLLLDRQGDSPMAAEPEADPQETGEPAEQRTLLLIRADTERQPATGVTLIAASADGPGLVLFLPTGTLVNIPGFGLERLGVAHQYGGAELLKASVENALGIAIDASATVTTGALAEFLDRSGGLTVDVPQRLVERTADGNATVRFESGAQQMDGERLAEYWTFGAPDDELDSFNRQQQIWGGLLDVAAGDADVRGRLIADGVPQFATEAEPEWMRQLLADVVRARDESSLRFSLLPVEPFGSGEGGRTFRIQDAEVDRLARTVLAASVPDRGRTESVRVQVLNGVGVPGVGQAVDRRLSGGGFRVVLTDNARNFDFRDTRIIVYNETASSLETARRVREHLGVGTIQVSRQPQSVVDVTIVVGADFPLD